MLLCISNLPLHTKYDDVKELLQSKCRLEDVILDKLEVTDGGQSMRVTVGVMEEVDAALIVRKINGLSFKGNRLYVQDKRHTKKGEQPYHPRAEILQQFSQHVTTPVQYPLQNIAQQFNQPMCRPLSNQTLQVPNPVLGVQAGAPSMGTPMALPAPVPHPFANMHLQNQRFSQPAVPFNQPSQQFNPPVQRFNQPPPITNQTGQQFNQQPQQFNETYQQLNQILQSINQTSQQFNQPPQIINQTSQQLQQILQQFNQQLQQFNPQQQSTATGSQNFQQFDQGRQQQASRNTGNDFSAGSVREQSPNSASINKQQSNQKNSFQLYNNKSKFGNNDNQKHRNQPDRPQNDRGPSTSGYNNRKRPFEHSATKYNDRNYKNKYDGTKNYSQRFSRRHARPQNVPNTKGMSSNPSDYGEFVELLNKTTQVLMVKLLHYLDLKGKNPDINRKYYDELKRVMRMKICDRVANIMTSFPSFKEEQLISTYMYRFPEKTFQLFYETEKKKINCSIFREFEKNEPRSRSQYDIDRQAKLKEELLYDLNMKEKYEKKMKYNYVNTSTTTVKSDSGTFDEMTASMEARLRKCEPFQMHPLVEENVNAEVETIGDIIYRELDIIPKELTNKHYNIAKEKATRFMIKFLKFALSRRITDEGLKMVRINGCPKLPDKSDLEQFLLQYNCIALERNINEPYYMAAFKSYKSVDDLVKLHRMTMGPIDDQIFLEFQHILEIPPPMATPGNIYWAKYGGAFPIPKSTKNQALIDAEESSKEVNYLDKNWPSQVAAAFDRKNNDYKVKSEPLELQNTHDAVYDTAQSRENVQDVEINEPAESTIHLTQNEDAQTQAKKERTEEVNEAIIHVKEEPMDQTDEVEVNINETINSASGNFEDQLTPDVNSSSNTLIKLENICSVNTDKQLNSTQCADTEVLVNKETVYTQKENENIIHAEQEQISQTDEMDEDVNITINSGSDNQLTDNINSTGNKLIEDENNANSVDKIQKSQEIAQKNNDLFDRNERVDGEIAPIIDLPVNTNERVQNKIAPNDCVNTNEKLDDENNSNSTDAIQKSQEFALKNNDFVDRNEKFKGEIAPNIIYYVNTNEALQNEITPRQNDCVNTNEKLENENNSNSVDSIQKSPEMAVKQ